MNSRVNLSLSKLHCSVCCEQHNIWTGNTMPCGFNWDGDTTWWCCTRREGSPVDWLGQVVVLVTGGIQSFVHSSRIVSHCARDPVVWWWTTKCSCSHALFGYRFIDVVAFDGVVVLMVAVLSASGAWCLLVSSRVTHPVMCEKWLTGTNQTAARAVQWIEMIEERDPLSHYPVNKKRPLTGCSCKCWSWIDGVDMATDRKSDAWMKRWPRRRQKLY